MIDPRERVIALAQDMLETLSDPTQAWDIALSDFQYEVDLMVHEWQQEFSGGCGWLPDGDSDREELFRSTCSHCGAVLVNEDCPNYGNGEEHA